MKNSCLTRAEPLPPMPSPQALERMRLYLIAEYMEARRVRRLAAAKRALSIANKLKNPAAKKKHRSRIFGAMNRLRGAV